MMRSDFFLVMLKVHAKSHLGTSKRRVAFVVADLIVADVELRKSSPNGFCVQNVMRNPESFRRRDGGGEEILHMKPGGLRAARDDQAAGDGQQIDSGFSFDLAPNLV